MAADPFEAAGEEEPATLVESMPTLSSGFDAGATTARPDPAGEEISWQLEEAGESSRLDAAASGAREMGEVESVSLPDLPELPSPTADRATPWLSAAPTHEIPLSPPAPDLAAAERFAESAAAAQWREVEETTAPHSTFSPAATQRFSVAAVTNEFPQAAFAAAPDLEAPAQIAALPEPGVASSASTIAFIPAAAPMAADLDDDATVLMPRTAAEPPPPETPAAFAAPSAAGRPTAPDHEPTVSRSRTTEVAPPSDLQGPGWAFSSMRAARSTGDNALHEEARRLARLLVSEIKLYNEDQVEEGRHNRDIYHRLKDDIDRSRQIYEERVHESVRGTTDYFQQELIRSLAGGDPRALGI